ncbi:hypothetical protein [Streptomyces barkulensis]|uniref:hypothetical protein n=1 Tax=Streptomyces barkulensis TaxID=1257026 RepID=UPI000C6D74FD|nr:hypothetical protein [Streptomyces barkulensis]
MSRGSDGEDTERGLVRRRRWTGAAVTCVATALALVHVLRPDLSIDSTAVALLVIALVPWMGDLFHSIELPGGARLEYRRLEERIGVAEERATRLDQQVDGAAATARVALAAAGSPDPEGWEGTGGDASWAVGALERLVTEYAAVRERMPSSSLRTARQERIFGEMLKVVPHVPGFDADAMLTSEEPGERLAALARLYVEPDPAKLEALLDATAREELPFLMYWCANTTDRLLSGTAADTYSVPVGLVRRLRTRLAEVPDGSDRARFLRRVLRHLDPSGPPPAADG